MIMVVVPFLHVSGMALYPFVLVRRADMKLDKVLVNHERIHLMQQLELLSIPFYLLYLGNYLVNRAKGQDHHTAYMHIIFEQEAYRQEANLNYLEKRKLWAWRNNKT